MRRGLFILGLLASLHGIAQDTLQIGKATVYSAKFEGHHTASGEIYHPQRLTAAHASLPLQSLVKVTNLQNNQSVSVKINDRMGYMPDHIIRLSKAAAKKLHMQENSVVYARITPLGEATIPQYAPDTTKLKAPAPNSGLFSMGIRPVYRNGYGIQVGLFKNIESLKRRMKKLQFGWNDNILVFIGQQDGETIFKAILGPFDTRYKAEAFKSNLPVLLGDEQAIGFIVALDELGM